MMEHDAETRIARALGVRKDDLCDVMIKDGWVWMEIADYHSSWMQQVRKATVKDIAAMKALAAIRDFDRVCVAPAVIG